MKRAVLISIFVWLGTHFAYAETLPEPVAGATMGVQFLGRDNIAKALKVAQPPGFKIVRAGIYWSRVEKRKGKYDFSYYDIFFREAKKKGYAVSATLFSNNPLYEKGDRAILTPAGRAGFARFAQAAAARYQDIKVFWEIWNEPNTRGFWRRGADTTKAAKEYTELVKAVVPAIRSANPKAYILAGSISALWRNSYKWFDFTIQHGLLETGINAVSVHPYGLCWPELALTKGYPAIRKRMDAAGAKHLSIVNTEVGYDTDWIKKCLGFSLAKTPEVQGWLLVRQQLVDLMANIGYSVWFQLREGKKWGVVNDAYKPRPAYYAAKTYSAQLAGYRYVDRIMTGSPNDYIIKMENKSGNQKLVVWTTEGKMSDGSIKQYIVGSPKQPKHSLEINVPGEGGVDYVNVKGVSACLPIINGKVTVLAEGGVKYLQIGGTSKRLTPTCTP